MEIFKETLSIILLKLFLISNIECIDKNLYKIYTNTAINNSILNPYLTSVSLKNRLKCICACNKDSICVSVLFNTKTKSCSLYSLRPIIGIETYQENLCYVFEKSASTSKKFYPINLT